MPVAMAADLATRRLVLHPLTVAEAEQIAAGVPGVGPGAVPWGEGYPGHTSRVGALHYLEMLEKYGYPAEFPAYEIRRRADGAAVGGIGFHGPPDDRGWVELGYDLVPAVWGQGFASEAVRGLLVFAREQGACGVAADTDVGNVASQRVLLAAGFVFEREEDGVRYYGVEL
ncbi:GNAT family N-acetyltransferase [Streptomyces sp. SID11385]|uniref:GNAT family N-acetyltransferase n=1 Tax=Streptomyces sp. SID11385 TaxID=2706031 RepID=UPI0013C65D31|nr:GNAT family N-acetyltransferase [Streptomyces sp. SID11385]NEA40095.1 GNAT family N-acetyltransferase [Streptomyces sp. SID11385]